MIKDVEGISRYIGPLVHRYLAAAFIMCFDYIFLQPFT